MSASVSVCVSIYHYIHNTTTGQTEARRPNQANQRGSRGVLAPQGTERRGGKTRVLRPFLSATNRNPSVRRSIKNLVFFDLSPRSQVRLSHPTIPIRQPSTIHAFTHFRSATSKSVEIKANFRYHFVYQLP